MGQTLAEAFPAAREVFQEVDDALGQSLSRIMWDGPEDELTLTANAQPALMAVSVAVMRVLEREANLDLPRHAAFLAGHSLGEYAALTVAGALSLSDTARLLRVRGEAMQAAVPVGEGAMAALLAIDLDAVEEKVLAEPFANGQLCSIANDNAPGQVVVSGHRAAVETAVERATAAGAKKGVLLPVSAPFHCPLMQPAADAMREALAGIQLSAPVVPIVPNVTAEAEGDPERLRALLVEQITGRVRWRESVLYMVGAGVDSVVEAGTGKVLSTMHKRIDRSLTLLSVGEPGDIDTLAATL